MSLKEIKHNDPTQLQQKIIYYQSELAKYKTKVEDYENNYHYSLLRSLKQDNIKIIEEKKRVSVQFEEVEKKLRGQIQSYSDQVKELNNLLINHKQDIEKLQQQKTNYEVTISEFQAKQKDYKINIKNMNMEIGSLNARLILQQAELEKLQDKNKDLLSDKYRLAEFEKLSNDLKNKNSKLESSISKLANERDAEKLIFEEKIEKLTKVNANLEDTISKIKGNIEEYKTKIENATKESQSLTIDLTQKQTDFEDLEHKYIKLQQENKKKNETIIEDQSIKKDLTLQIEKFNKEIQTYKKKITQLEKLTNDLKDKNSTLDTYIERLESDRHAEKLLQEEKNKQIIDLQKKIKFSKCEIEQFEKQNIDYQEEKMNLMLKIKQLEEADKKREQLEKENTLLSASFNQLNKELIENKNFITDLNKQIKQLQKENTLRSASSDQLNKELNSHNQQLQKENLSLSSSIDKLKNELNRNKDLNELLNSKILELQKANESYVTLIKSEMKNLLNNQNDIVTKVDKVHLDIGSFIPQFTLLINKDQEFSTLIHLEKQFKQILADSFDYEEKLDSKSMLIKELENKLFEITNEIEDIKFKHDKKGV
ncbi:hypothetical protein [Metabacillus halosaccharovorans]|uniref:Uncharacterized protein n=1 Tax=Metabacillus halosaccharovorans TaxID=930124 RepID=A0ABT3DEZ2_9BACI|nr:hypothetical protein [Metabacillus halosaccharovorans]MCV9885436.1 hypothetical protein [Metabacillus halosaccharovorans]